MKPHRIAGNGSIILGTAVATSAMLGPTVLKVVKFRLSDNLVNQFVGGDIVSLGMVAPALVGAGALWLRGRRIAPALAIGPALYAVYTFGTVIIGQEYSRYPGNVEKFFPLYAGLVGGSVILSGYAWSQLPEAAIPAPSTGLRRTLSGVFIGTGGLIGLAWSAQIRMVLTGNPPADYADEPTLFWLIRLLDFGFCIPAVVAVGIGLARRSPLADRAAVAVAGFITCLTGSVTGMAIAMQLRDDPAASPLMILILTPATLGFGYVTWRLLTGQAQDAGNVANRQTTEREIGHEPRTRVAL